MIFKSKKPFKVALVLGGGGARGMAHIGIIKVFEKEKIPIDLVVGTSAGAMFGGMYCQLGSALAVEKKMIDFLHNDIYESSGLKQVVKRHEHENFFGQLSTRLRERIVINMAYSRQGLVKHFRLRNVIDFLLVDQNIEDTKIQFAAVAVDLIKAEEMVFTKGNIRLAVDASSSLPGYFTPVKYDGKYLVDGAVLQVIPAPVAKALGADFVIAVNVSQDLEEKPDLDNVVNIIFRASSVTNNRYNQTLLNEADIVIRPSIGHLHWSEFNCLKEAIAKGEEIAIQALPLLKQKLENASKKSFHLFRNTSEQKIVEMVN